MWSVEKQEIIRDWSLGDIGAVLYLKFSNDYRYLAIYAAGKKLNIIISVYPEGKEVHHFRDVPGGQGGGEPYPMTFFDGSKFFTFPKGNEVCVYDTETWKEKWCVSSSADDKD